MRMHKKGALELSINAIVIVILAMTLLGLGLGFVRSLFMKVNTMSDDTFEKMSEQLNIDLATSDAPLLFSKTRMTLDRGGATLEGLGVKNDGDQQMVYGIKVITFNCPTEWKEASVCQPTDTWFEYFKGDTQYTLKAAERLINKIQINIPRNAFKGLYLIKIIVYQGVWPASNSCIITIGADSCEIFGQTELFLTIG